MYHEHTDYEIFVHVKSFVLKSLDRKRENKALHLDCLHYWYSHYK